MARVSKSAENAIARELVNGLHANGMSYKEIGRRLGGRDSSLVSQIAHGKPKGASFVDALRQIQTGEKSVSVPRRTTSAGTEAKVRRGVETIPGTDNIKVKTKGGNKTVISGLDQVSGTDKMAKWNVHFTKIRLYRTDGPIVNDAWVPGRLPRGWTIQTLQDRINNPQAGDNWKPGNATQALASIALEQNSEKIYGGTGRIEVEMFTSD